MLTTSNQTPVNDILVLVRSVDVTSTNDGTLKEKSAFVATMPLQTASGVGAVGGDAGLNAATMNPAVGYNGYSSG